MVISVRRRGLAPNPSEAMAPPPRPRSPFGGPPMLQQNAPPAGAMRQQPAPQPQPQQSPIQDLFSQQFEKPEMTWSDKLGMLSAALRDYDGTLGQDNFAREQQRYDQRVQQAQQEHMLQQLGQMPGVTDQQRALLSMGIGAEQLAERAFAPPPEPKDPFVVNGRVVDRSDPTRVIADYREAPEAEYTYETVGNDIVAIDKRDPNNRIVVGPAPVKQPLVNVNTGATGPEIGTIPQGFAAVRDPNNPSGFRMEAIPGGPAGIEAMGAATAKSALDNTFDGIMQSYLDLQDKGAIRDTEATTGENISAFLKSSPPGRLIGKATGSEAESLRETIEALQPSITQAIMSQPGMSARSMDSQRELEFFMKSITTPTADVWANFTTLHALDKRFGSGQLMNRMLQQGRITPDDYARITRSPRVNDIINRVDSKIGELFVMDGQGGQMPAQNDGLPPGFVVIE